MTALLTTRVQIDYGGYGMALEVSAAKSAAARYLSKLM